MNYTFGTDLIVEVLDTLLTERHFPTNQKMKQIQQKLQFSTQGKTLIDITQIIQNTVTETDLCQGVCTLFIRHTSASFVIQENADEDVLQDLETFFSKLVSEKRNDFLHTAEGPDDMPSHIRSALTHTSEQIPFQNRRLLLGTWQGIYLWEHRANNRRREIVVHLIGE